VSIRGQFCLFTLLLVLFVAASAKGQETMGQPGLNVEQMKFGAIPGMPTCATGTVLSGDPTKGGSILLAKISAGCSIPWHWHTPTESLMLVSGVARVEMKDGKPVTIKAGGFAMMPTHHIHQFFCERDCLLYIQSDASFDMHYVNAQGTEITPAEALKAVKETAATGTK
jgi:quercetin dioxygenase-like cupin family protein